MNDKTSNEIRRQLTGKRLHAVDVLNYGREIVVVDVLEIRSKNVDVRLRFVDYDAGSHIDGVLNGEPKRETVDGVVFIDSGNVYLMPISLQADEFFIANIRSDRNPA